MVYYKLLLQYQEVAHIHLIKAIHQTLHIHIDYQQLAMVLMAVVFNILVGGLLTEEQPDQI